MARGDARLVCGEACRIPRSRGLSGGPFPGPPPPPPPGPRPRRRPTCKVILGRVAGGGPQEVLGAPVLSKPVEFAALRASPPAHPQVLTCAGKSAGFSRGQELRPGGFARGPRRDTPRSTSDGQTALPFASPELPGSTGGSLAGSSTRRALLPDVAFGFRHSAPLLRVSEDSEPLLWPSSGEEPTQGTPGTLRFHRKPSPGRKV